MGRSIQVEIIGNTFIATKKFEFKTEKEALKIFNLSTDGEEDVVNGSIV